VFKKNTDKGLKIVTYTMTFIFLILITIPFFYIVSLSLQDENAIYTYPPRFLPIPGVSISIVLDYSKYKDKTEKDLEDIVLKDSALAMYSTIYEFSKDTIGEVKVYGTIDGKTVYYSRAHGLMLKLQQLYGVYKLTQISSMVLLAENRYKISADTIGYDFDYNGIDKNYDSSKLGKDKYSSQISDYLNTTFKTSGAYQGTVVSQSYLLLLENYKYYYMMPQYVYANYPNIKNYSFFAFMFNTILTLVWAMLCQIILCALTAYPLSRLLSKKVANRVLLFFLATMMIPFIAYMIPQILLVKSWGMFDTYAGMLLPWLAPAPFYIFLYKGFFDRIPSAFFDAAKIDGASELYTFLNICLPMSKSIISLIALQAFISGWGDFFWYYLVANRPNLWTLNVAIFSISQLTNVRQNFLMGLSVVTILPVLIVATIFSKQIKNSIMSSGIKG